MVGALCCAPGFRVYAYCWPEKWFDAYYLSPSVGPLCIISFGRVVLTNAHKPLGEYCLVGVVLAAIFGCFLVALCLIMYYVQRQPERRWHCCFGGRRLRLGTFSARQPAGAPYDGDCQIYARVVRPPGAGVSAAFSSVGGPPSYQTVVALAPPLHGCSSPSGTTVSGARAGHCPAFVPEHYSARTTCAHIGIS